VVIRFKSDRPKEGGKIFRSLASLFEKACRVIGCTKLKRRKSSKVINEPIRSPVDRMNYFAIGAQESADGARRLLCGHPHQAFVDNLAGMQSITDRKD
jgi:hypothetical protein